MARYTPRKGDFVVVTFGPHSGHEQRERRPALVVSNDLFNRHTGLAIVCPVTNTARDYPFHVSIPVDSGISGFVMVEQVKSLDFRARKGKRVGQAPPETLD